MYNNVDIDTTETEGSGGYRGAKGSLRDRLISIFYRKRYEKFKLQKEFYTKDNLNKKIIYIKTLKNFKIDNMNKLDKEEKNVVKNLEFYIPFFPLTKKHVDIYVPDTDDINHLHLLSEEIINSQPEYELNGKPVYIDPSKEQFDFNKYDYYELEEIKKGISIKNDEEEIIEIEKEEEKTKDEKVIVEEINVSLKCDFIIEKNVNLVKGFTVLDKSSSINLLMDTCIASVS